MQVQFDGQGMDVSSALRDLALKKLERLSHADKITNIHVTFKVEHEITQAANATIHMPGTVINAHAKSEDMYKTIDILTHNIQTQLTKHKEKNSRHRIS